MAGTGQDAKLGGELLAEGGFYAEVEQQLDELAADYEQLSIEQSETLAQIEEISAQIAETEAQIASAEEDIEKLEAQLAEQRERLGKRVSSAYKAGGSNVLSVFLSSETFEELGSNIYYLDKISAQDRQMIDDVEETKERLDARKADLEAHKAELEEQQEALEQVTGERLKAIRAKLAEIYEQVQHCENLEAENRENVQLVLQVFDDAERGRIPEILRIAHERRDRLEALERESEEIRAEVFSLVYRRIENR